MNDIIESIRRRAYEIWERAGRPEGDHHRHWEQARRELAEEPNPEIEANSINGTRTVAPTHGPNETRHI